MARTKKSKSLKSAKSSKPSKSSKSIKSASSTTFLQKEHEDDVRESLLCVIRTKQIPKQTLLEIAGLKGIRNHVVSTLDKVRGVDTVDAVDSIADDDETNSNDDKKQKKGKNKTMDFYDPSILAPTANEIENTELLFKEVIDLARGGIGGHYTNTLQKKRKQKQRQKHKHKTKTKKKKRKRKRDIICSSSLNSLPSSTHNSPETKKRKLSSNHRRKSKSKSRGSKTSKSKRKKRRVKPNSLALM